MAKRDSTSRPNPPASEATAQALKPSAADWLIALGGYLSHRPGCPQIEIVGSHKCECGLVEAQSLLIDALSSAQDPGWQPIATAPKDTPVLTCRGAGLMAVAEDIPDPREPHSGKREWCCTDGVFLLNVTHWMPLPDPPAQAPRGAR